MFERVEKMTLLTHLKHVGNLMASNSTAWFLHFVESSGSNPLFLSPVISLLLIRQLILFITNLKKHTIFVKLLILILCTIKTLVNDIPFENRFKLN